VRDALESWAQSIGEALLSSPLGASELVVGLLVGTTFLAFAANTLIPNLGAHAWSRREPPRR
jgi:hypothetical protein